MVLNETDLDLYRHPALPQSWKLPEDVTVEDDAIVFKMSEHSTPSGDAGMLEGFLALADAPAHKVADYAQLWGVLGLCKHHYPMHWPHLKLPCAAGWTMREPVAAWQNMARTFGALLDLAARVEQGVISEPAQTREIQRFNGGWRYPRVEDLEWWSARPEADRTRWQLAQDRLNVADALNHLLANSVQVVVSYPAPGNTRPVMSYAARSLVDALALQAAMAACRAESIVSCDGCGVAFAPSSSYRPRPGQRRFCDLCRASGVPQKLADRDRRARLREQSTKKGR